MTPDKQTLETIHEYYGRILVGEDVEKVNSELQVFSFRGEWKPVVLGPDEIKRNWDIGGCYRFAPRTHTVNGFEVPAPMGKEPEEGFDYYVTDILKREMVLRCEWSNHAADRLRFRRRLCHASREAALANSLAMIGLDPTTNVEDV